MSGQVVVARWAGGPPFGAEHWPFGEPRPAPNVFRHPRTAHLDEIEAERRRPPDAATFLAVEIIRDKPLSKRRAILKRLSAQIQVAREADRLHDFAELANAYRLIVEGF